MSLTSIRFRTEGELVVLQVAERVEGVRHYGCDNTATWRDARVSDLIDVSRFIADYESLARRLETLEMREAQRTFSGETP